MYAGVPDLHGFTEPSRRADVMYIQTAVNEASRRRPDISSLVFDYVSRVLTA